MSEHAKPISPIEVQSFEHDIAQNKSQPTYEYTMYIFVNTDLGMRAGKLCSQCAHVSEMIGCEIIRSRYEQNPIPQSYYDYMRWKNDGSKKIVLRATEEQLRKLIEMEEKPLYVIDAGRTQIEPNSLTVVGFRPTDKLKDRFKEYKLL
jgi:peptidyl-tRNA hydrolase